MARLNSPTTSPPDGWRYTQMETPALMEALNGPDLIDMVVAHRVWKEITPIDRESVQRDIERQICASMPPGICQPENGEKYEPFNDLSRNLTLDKIESFSAALFEWIKSGAKFVDEAISVPRGTICLKCPYNKAPPSCSCAPLWSFLKSVIPGNRLRDNLHVCGICGCALSVKTLAPDNVIRESEMGRGHVYPAYCWIKPLIA